MTAPHSSEAEPNDPTRSGPPMPVDKGACLSSNEIEQLCLKASRGAGMSWGLAEEAGFAAAWLAKRGLDGAGALLAQLQDAEGRPWNEICPVVTSGRFQPVEGGSLCPIALGSVLCDHAQLPETAMQDAPLRLGPVTQPVLLLAFLSDLAQARGSDLRLDWSGGSVWVTADGRMTGDTNTLASETRLQAKLSVEKATQDVPTQSGLSNIVAPDVLDALNAFALRTTVPASEASRAGAGAAAGDND